MATFWFLLDTSAIDYAGTIALMETDHESRGDQNFSLRTNIAGTQAFCKVQGSQGSDYDLSDAIINSYDSGTVDTSPPFTAQVDWVAYDPDIPNGSFYRYHKVKPFYDALSTARCAIYGIGDSNQIYQGCGTDDGAHQALSQAGFQCWATPLHGGLENSGNGSAMGSISNTLNNSGFASFGSLTISNATLNSFNMNHDGAGQVHQAVQINSSPGQNGMVVNPNYSLMPGRVWNFNTHHALRFKMVYGETAFDESPVGKLNPHARRDGSPFTSYLATNIEVPTDTAQADGYNTWNQDVVAGTVVAGIPIQFSHSKISGGNTTTGVGVVYYLQVVDKDHTFGYAYNTLVYLGGQTARDMALWLQGRNDEALTLFFKTMRDEQGGGPSLFRINSGLNDVNIASGSASVGPNAGITPGASADAFADNVSGIIERIRAIWTLNAWPLTELYFEITVAHPIAHPNNTTHEAYKIAIRTVCDTYDRCAMSDYYILNKLADYDVRGWYESGNVDATVRPHKRPQAYVREEKSKLSDIRLISTPQTYVQIPVSEGGYLTRASNLTTLLSDSQQGTISFVLNPTRAVNDVDYIMRMLNVADGTVMEIYEDASRQVNLDVYNAVGTRIVQLRPQGWLGQIYNNTRSHYLLSWNNTGSLFSTSVNDCISNSVVASVTSAGVPAFTTVTKMSIGATQTGTSPFDGGIGEFWAKFGTYTDFATLSNRRLFNDSNGDPIVLPTDGIVGGMTPDIYFRAADFATGVNRGAGGDFTVAGSSVVTNKY